MKLLSFDKLKTIAKAKFSDKSNLGDWYTKRLEICNQCPLNHLNKVAAGQELSVRDRAWVTANFGKATCLGCGCEISAKASVESEICGAVKVGLEPAWLPIPQTEVQTAAAGKLKVWNHNPEKADLTISNTGELILNYGIVDHAFDSTVLVRLETEEGAVDQVKVSAGCGCTNVKGHVGEGGKMFVTIGYDTVGRKGPVTKTFNVTYKVNGRMRLLVGKLQINVKPPKGKN